MRRALAFLLGKDDGDDFPPLSGKEAVILGLLIERGEMYGLQVVAESNGIVGRGTVYVTLSRMEDKKYVESRQEVLQSGAIGLPRRLYAVTGRGAEVFRTYEELAATAAARVLV